MRDFQAMVQSAAEQADVQIVDIFRSPNERAQYIWYIKDGADCITSVGDRELTTTNDRELSALVKARLNGRLKGRVVAHLNA